MEAERSSSDIISTLPEHIIQTILCLVPIRDAARTSILAKEWRYNWTKIPKLVFKEQLFEVSSRKNQLSAVAQTLNIPDKVEQMIKRCEFLFAVHQVLLLRQGPIHDFTLEMVYAGLTCLEIDHIILHLSRNHTLKKFALDTNSYKLPLSMFLLRQLTDLSLCGCNLELKPTFNGFGYLKSLYLSTFEFSTKTILHLLSNCPVLTTLTLCICWYFDSDDYSSTVIELFECLPVIEHMTMFESAVPCFIVDSYIPEVLPTSIINLKYFCFREMSFINNEFKGLPFLAFLIRSSPNLEKLSLQVAQSLQEDSEIDYFRIEDYTDIWLGHLNEMEIKDFANSKPELDFVKLILAKSPVLKILRILICPRVSNHEELKLLRILLRSQRVSLAVNIFVERG